MNFVEYYPLTKAFFFSISCDLNLVTQLSKELKEITILKIAVICLELYRDSIYLNDVNRDFKNKFRTKKV